MEEKYIIAMVGHTAAGKTTLAKYLSEKIKAQYISEGDIKRSLKTQYVSENSLDEDLRDIGYNMAIDRCIKLLLSYDIVILDASFHRMKRRRWVYDALSGQSKINVIWMYCDCPNESTVRERLQKRAQATEKNADNQADKFYIYQYIKSTFDSVSISDFCTTVGSAIISVDTATNLITKVEKNDACTTVLLEELTTSILPEYLHMKQAAGGFYG